jgi:probable phosphoglycerate mutase
MLQIVLIRPGATEYDRQGRIQGTLDIPLSEEGREEVDRMIAELRGLPLDVLYVTRCQAAQETAQAIADALDLKLKKLDKMRNLDHGLWQGLLIEDVKTKQPKVYRQWQEQPETICPPGGEMLGMAQRRVRAGILRLLKKHKAGHVGLVAPEPLASLICNVLRQDELGDLWKTSECRRWEIIPVQPDAVACDK